MRLAAIATTAAVIALVPVGATFAVDAGKVSVARGAQVAITGGCHDCHTAGYNESGGKVDPNTALKGTGVGWQGPWGTTYAKNLRLSVAPMSEDQFVAYAKTFTAMPPMPYYNVHAMDETDMRSLYQYIKSLGAPGAAAPDALPPGVKPKTPFVVNAPPTLPTP
jgi:mono/diheme cytochrome c family protein